MCRKNTQKKTTKKSKMFTPFHYFYFRVETIDGSAVGGEDFVFLNQVVVFEANEVEKQVSRNTKNVFELPFSTVKSLCNNVNY